MTPTLSARSVLALVCAVGLLAAASAALADDDSGYLGVHLQDIDSSMAKALQLGDRTGVLVSDVIKESPAASAGLEDGDVILEFGGEALENTGDLSRAVRDTKPGKYVEVLVLREGKQQTVKVQIGERENDLFWVSEDGDYRFDKDKNLHIEHFGDGDETQFFIQRMKDGHQDLDVFVQGLNTDRGYMGVHLDDLNEQLGEFFGVKDGEGTLVTEVIEDSPAAAAGLKAGDVIVKVDDEDIGSTADLHAAMRHTEADQEVALEIKRGGKRKTIDVKLDEMPEDAIERQIKIIGEGDDFHVIAPKMMHRVPHMKRTMRVSPPQQLEIIREYGEAEEDLEEMREDLEKMRVELDELRKELKK